MLLHPRNRPEAVVTGVLLVLAVAFLLFIGSLVAPPKMLLGRMMTAIQPSLFPMITMVMMVALCALSLWLLSRRTEVEEDAEAEDRPDWVRLAGFFAILVLYALLFVPIGFFLSTALALVLLAVLTGNRNPWQIAALAVVSPIGLYIVSTRFLLVSLPELSRIEFAYAAVLGR